MKLIQKAMILGLGSAVFAAPQAFAVVTASPCDGATNNNGDTVAWCYSTGMVSPTTYTLTARSISLITVDRNNKSSGQFQIWRGTKEITFAATDTNFAKISMGNIGVPAGRYGGVVLEYNRDTRATLNGVTYQGLNFAGTAGTTATYYSNTKSAVALNSVTTSNPGTAGTLTELFKAAGTATSNGSGDTDTTQSVFPPACVTNATVTVDANNLATADGGGCKTGDYVVKVGTTIPAVTILFDLSHFIGIDIKNDAARMSPSYPIPIIGDAGAAIHLSNYDAATGGTGDITLLFNQAGQLVYASSWTNSTGAYNATVSQGIAGVDGSAGFEPGMYFNTGAATTYNGVSVGAGEIQFIIGDGGTGTRLSRGVIKLSDIRSLTCGNNITVSGITLAQSVFNGSGASSSSNSGGFVAGSSVTLKVQKVQNSISGNGSLPATCGSYP